MAKKTIDISLSSVETQALGRVIKKTALAKSRETMGPGLYPVDITVRISGNLKVGEDSEKTPTVRIPQKKVMALMLAKAGAIRPHLLTLMEECIGEVIAAQVQSEASGEEGEEPGEVLQDAYAEAYDQIVAKFCAGLPKIRERGHVSAKLVMERVESPAEK